MVLFCKLFHNLLVLYHRLRKRNKKLNQKKNKDGSYQGEVTPTRFTFASEKLIYPLKITQISVKDNGIGIDKKDHKTIFQEFKQVDDSASKRFEGTGIGLALTKELTELMGGSIAVKSKLGEGTEFLVKLPILKNDESGTGA